MENLSGRFLKRCIAIALGLSLFMTNRIPHSNPSEFLNSAANDNDIRTGTAYAEKIGIKIIMPKWGYSKGEYFFNSKDRIIAKGLASIKYMGEKVAEELYGLAEKNKSSCFVDILKQLNTDSSINTKQLDILIKLDFFSDFGNQRELLYITDLFYGTFKCGDAKQIKKMLVDGTVIEPIIQQYAVSVTKSGGIAKNYTLLNVMAILYEIEDLVKNTDLDDLDDITKVKNFYDVMGYVGYVSGKEEDRRKFYVTDVKPLHGNSDKKCSDTVSLRN